MSQKKTNAQKKVEGTFRHDRAKDNYLQIKPLSEIPDPPDELAMDEMAVKLWHWHLEELVTYKVVAKTDLIQYAAYCIEMSRYYRMNEFLMEKGETFKTSTGYPQVRPEVSISRNALKIAIDIANKFGLNPISRDQLPDNRGDDKDQDELGKLLNE